MFEITDLFIINIINDILKSDNNIKKNIYISFQNMLNNHYESIISIIYRFNSRRGFSKCFTKTHLSPVLKSIRFTHKYKKCVNEFYRLLAKADKKTIEDFGKIMETIPHEEKSAKFVKELRSSIKSQAGGKVVLYGNKMMEVDDFEKVQETGIKGSMFSFFKNVANYADPGTMDNATTNLLKAFHTLYVAGANTAAITISMALHRFLGLNTGINGTDPVNSTSSSGYSSSDNTGIANNSNGSGNGPSSEEGADSGSEEGDGSGSAQTSVQPDSTGDTLASSGTSTPETDLIEDTGSGEKSEQEESDEKEDEASGESNIFDTGSGKGMSEMIHSGEDTFNRGVEGAREMANEAKEKIGNALGEAREKANELGNKFANSETGKKISSAVEGSREMANEAKEKIGNALGEAREKANELGNKFANSETGKKISSAVGEAREKAEKAVSKAKEMGKKITESKSGMKAARALQRAKEQAKKIRKNIEKKMSREHKTHEHRHEHHHEHHSEHHASHHSHHSHHRGGDISFSKYVEKKTKELKKMEQQLLKIRRESPEKYFLEGKISILTKLLNGISPEKIGDPDQLANRIEYLTKIKIPRKKTKYEYFELQEQLARILLFKKDYEDYNFYGGGNGEDSPKTSDDNGWSDSQKEKYNVLQAQLTSLKEKQVTEDETLANDFATIEANKSKGANNSSDEEMDSDKEQLVQAQTTVTTDKDDLVQAKSKKLQDQNARLEAYEKMNQDYQNKHKGQTQDMASLDRDNYNTIHSALKRPIDSTITIMQEIVTAIMDSPPVQIITDMLEKEELLLAMGSLTDLFSVSIDMTGFYLDVVTGLMSSTTPANLSDGTGDKLKNMKIQIEVASLKNKLELFQKKVAEEIACIEIDDNTALSNDKYIDELKEELLTQKLNAAKKYKIICDNEIKEDKELKEAKEKEKEEKEKKTNSLISTIKGEIYKKLSEFENNAQGDDSQEKVVRILLDKAKNIVKESEESPHTLLEILQDSPNESPQYERTRVLLNLYKICDDILKSNFKGSPDEKQLTAAKSAVSKLKNYLIQNISKINPEEGKNVSTVDKLNAYGSKAFEDSKMASQTAYRKVIKNLEDESNRFFTQYSESKEKAAQKRKARQDARNAASQQGGAPQLELGVVMANNYHLIEKMDKNELLKLIEQMMSQLSKLPPLKSDAEIKGALVFMIYESNLILVFDKTFNKPIGQWTIPGGGRDKGDSIAKTAQKELMEETKGLLYIPEEVFNKRNCTDIYTTFGYYRCYFIEIIGNFDITKYDKTTKKDHHYNETTEICSYNMKTGTKSDGFKINESFITGRAKKAIELYNEAYNIKPLKINVELKRVNGTVYGYPPDITIQYIASLSKDSTDSVKVNDGDKKRGEHDNDDSEDDEDETGDNKGTIANILTHATGIGLGVYTAKLSRDALKKRENNLDLHVVIPDNTTIPDNTSSQFKEAIEGTSSSDSNVHPIKPSPSNASSNTPSIKPLPASSNEPSSASSDTSLLALPSPASKSADLGNLKNLITDTPLSYLPDKTQIVPVGTQSNTSPVSSVTSSNAFLYPSSYSVDTSLNADLAAPKSVDRVKTDSEMKQYVLELGSKTLANENPEEIDNKIDEIQKNVAGKITDDSERSTFNTLVDSIQKNVSKMSTSLATGLATGATHLTTGLINGAQNNPQVVAIMLAGLLQMTVNKQMSINNLLYNLNTFGDSLSDGTFVQSLTNMGHSLGSVARLSHVGGKLSQEDSQEDLEHLE